MLVENVLAVLWGAAAQFECKGRERSLGGSLVVSAIAYSVDLASAELRMSVIGTGILVCFNPTAVTVERS